MVVERMYSVKEKLLLFKWYLMVRGQEMGLEIGGILEKKLRQKNSGLKLIPRSECESITLLVFEIWVR